MKIRRVALLGIGLLLVGGLMIWWQRQPEAGEEKCAPVVGKKLRHPGSGAGAEEEMHTQHAVSARRSPGMLGVEEGPFPQKLQGYLTMLQESEAKRAVCVENQHEGDGEKAFTRVSYLIQPPTEDEYVAWQRSAAEILAGCTPEELPEIKSWISQLDSSYAFGPDQLFVSIFNRDSLDGDESIMSGRMPASAQLDRDPQTGAIRSLTLSGSVFSKTYPHDAHDFRFGYLKDEGSEDRTKNE